MSKQETCKQRVGANLRERIADIRKLWKLWREDSDVNDPDLGNFNEYGLSFDYVAPETFEGQRRGYWRWQLSWGGPSDEFRFYADENYQPTRVEYWFMDWFDGAKMILRGKRRELLDEIWDDWRDCELPQTKMREAMESA